MAEEKKKGLSETNADQIFLAFGTKSLTLLLAFKSGLNGNVCSSYLSIYPSIYLSIDRSINWLINPSINRSVNPVFFPVYLCHRQRWQCSFSAYISNTNEMISVIFLLNLCHWHRQLVPFFADLSHRHRRRVLFSHLFLQRWSMFLSCLPLLCSCLWNKAAWGWGTRPIFHRVRHQESTSSLWGCPGSQASATWDSQET